MSERIAMIREVFLKKVGFEFHVNGQSSVSQNPLLEHWDSEQWARVFHYLAKELVITSQQSKQL